MKRQKNPCIDVCEFTGPKGWCIGCGRTQQECDKWKTMKPYARNTLDKELQRRMSKIKSLFNAP
ncbi:MAG: DUF1289 domain-containing protein [Gammaproteobacteria bacterium]|nr:MAG: DUF1289 domain-containing protein [Gammaproteobacteria bacterium]